MNLDLWNCIFLSALFLSLFGVGELLYHKFGVKAELTRKWSHIGTGILTLLFPIMLSSHWYVLLMCSSFALILIASMRFKLLPSINAVDRKTLGSILYPVSVYLCFLSMSFSKVGYTGFYLPILSLALADPAAALIGKKWGKKKYTVFQENKSYMGSAACAIVAGLLCFTALRNQWPDSSFGFILVFSFIYAIIISTAEAFSTKGWDNLSIPLAGLITLQLAVPFS
jgi:dolichol kinase